MSNFVRHPFHLVDESPWPVWAALVTFIGMAGSLKCFITSDSVDLFISMGVLFWISKKWWENVSMEGTMMGLHTSKVELGLRWGMTLFIISEVLFFVSFFWAFFHSSLFPALITGGTWPPVGVKVLDPFGVPLLNTVILLSSGSFVTWAHHSMMVGKHSETFFSLLVTIILGVYFTGLQAMEYLETSFTMADSVYGSTFFLTTGFHGLHVIIGTVFLMVCLIRLGFHNFSKSHHFGFEAAAWYWHFVDVVWLFLYNTIYWWGI